MKNNIKKGIYRDGKILFSDDNDLESDSSKTNHYDVMNINEWWPYANQEVKFKIDGDKAIILSLGEKKSYAYVEKNYLSII